MFWHRLRRVLQGLAHLFPDVGYCQASITNSQSWLSEFKIMLTSWWQGMGMIAASLLLFLKEDDTFWMMACIVQVRTICSSAMMILNQILNQILSNLCQICPN